MIFFILWMVTLVLSVEAQQISEPTICRDNPTSKNCYLAMWKYASMSYCPESVKQNLGAQSCSSSCSSYTNGLCDLKVYTRGGNAFFASENVEAFVYRRDRDVFVAFAGTDPLSPDIPALLPGTSSYLRGIYPQYTKVARGPNGHLNYVFGEVAQCLINSHLFNTSSSTDTAGKLYITGHSLGGAMAQIAAVRLNVEKQIPAENIAVYAFNGIRAGNPAFAGQLDNSTNKMAQSIRENADVAERYPSNIPNVLCLGCMDSPRPGPYQPYCRDCLIQAGSLTRTGCGPSFSTMASNPFSAHGNIYGINFNCKTNGSTPMNAAWKSSCP